MNTLKLHINIFFILIWSFSFAQEYKNYTIKNGLPSNHVYRITQDHHGFIWIITDKGISKFDGENFKNFTTRNGLPTNDIWDIKITSDNKIWYFSKSNKLGYIQNDSVYNFSTEKNILLYPRTLYTHDNKVSFNDGQNTYSLINNTWQSVFTNMPLKYTTSIHSKLFHPKTTAFKVHFYNNTSHVLFFKNKDTLKSFTMDKLGPNDFYGHTKQVNDSLVIVARENGYLSLNLNNYKVTNYYINGTKKNPKELRYTRTHIVNNSIQLTGTNFVGSLNKNQHLVNIITIPEKLNSHFSFIDKTGNIWSASFNKGIYFKANSSAKTIAKNQKVQLLKCVKDKLYTGIYKHGFFELKKDSLYQIIKNNEFQYSISFLNNLKSTFFSSWHEIHQLKNGGIKEIKSNLPPEKHNALGRNLIEFNGKIYGNNSFGITKINPKTLHINKQLKMYGVISYATTSDKLFTANQSGLFEITKNDSIIKLNSHKTHNNPILSLSNYTPKNIIVGTDGFGAYLTDGEKIEFIKNTATLSIQSIFVATDKSIWLATDNGIHKSIKNDTGFSIIQSYYEADGLVSNKTNSVAVKNDTLFVATDIGLSIINLKQKTKNQLQDLYIKSVSSGNNQLIDSMLTFPYKPNNYFTASFGAIDYRNQQNLTYSFKLNPIQKKWTVSKTSDINFTNLYPGKYTLELKVKNHHKKQISKKIYINITPLWYQTLIAKFLFVLSSIIVLILLYKWNKKRIQKIATKKIEIKQQLAEQELYALRSQMNPHFVFNSLNAIQYYITKNEIDLSEKYLVKFSRLIRMFFDFSAEKNITIHQEIELLKGYLEIEKMRFGKGFNYIFNIDDQLHQTTQVPTMLLQPIVENSVNHGVFHNNKIGTIVISFNYLTKHQFEVSIEDDGIGIKKAQEIKANSLKKHSSKSSKIITDRIQLMNLSNEWKISQEITDLTSNDTSGTKVTLTFKKLI